MENDIKSGFCFLNFFLILLLHSIGFSQTGILGALPREIRLLRNEIIIEKEVKEAGRTFVVGKLKGKDVVAGMSLHGKVNAGVTAQLLITLFNVEKIIFTGVAGAVDPDLQPGDIIVSTDVFQHDVGQWNPQGFELWDVNISEDSKITFFKSDSGLIALALEVGKELRFAPVEKTQGKQVPKVIAGRIATGDQFIAWSKKRKWLLEIFQARAVDMEGGAVAQVCYQNKIPFVLIRCISDLADENAEGDYRKFVETAAENSARLVKRMIVDIE